MQRTVTQDSITEAPRLRDGAYSSDRLLNKRRDLYQFATPAWNLEEEIMRRLPLASGEQLLDVGCGSGALLIGLAKRFPTAHLVGLDIAPGVYAHAAVTAEQQHLAIQFTTGNVQDLPFKSQSFDHVTAIHMIYHVPDVQRGLSEIARVLKPGGMVLLTVNSQDSMPRMRMLKREAAQLMGIPLYSQADDRFNTELGKAQLQQHFADVRLKTFPSTIRLRDPEPYVRYFDSTRPFWQPTPSDHIWDQALAMIQEQVRTQIEQTGAFEDSKTFGIFTGKKL